MFVGAGSASTGGGIKLTTIIVIIVSVITYIRGKQDIVIAKRSITNSILLRALAISSIGLLAIFIAIFLLCITENAPFGTVGLSWG
ncbi:hypothetical protein J6TS2_38460 [Heyndrickxia sporothermodurans]|nr:hypothetical protein J6TS2_38460 [Heyndrickxia sporothermodurans]